MCWYHFNSPSMCTHACPRPRVPLQNRDIVVKGVAVILKGVNLQKRKRAWRPWTLHFVEITCKVVLSPVMDKDGFCKNPHLSELDTDTLYHIGYNTKDHDMKELFSDVKVSKCIYIYIYIFFFFLCNIFLFINTVRGYGWKH